MAIPDVRKTVLQNGAGVGAYLAAYTALDWISFIEPFGTLGITPWTPSAGLSFALLLRHGMRFAPAVFAAVLLADLLFRDMTAAPLAMTLSALAIALGYGCAATLLRDWLRISPRLDHGRDLLRLLAVAFCATAAVATTVSVLFLAAGLVSGGDFLSTVLHFWVGDLIGIAALTPFLLLLFGLKQIPAMQGRLLSEYGLQFAAICVGLWIIFGIETVHHFEFSYILFLPLIWIALRDGLIGATWGVVATQIGVILASQIKGLDTDAITQFQLLMLAVAVTGLFVGSAVDERRRAEARLKEHDAELAHAARLAATGEMAGALAHELNQPLTSLIGFARACQAVLEAPQDNDSSRRAARDLIDQAVQQAIRAGDIIRSTREFLSHGDMRLVRDEVPRILDSILGLVQARAKRHGVTIAIRCAEALPPVLIDPIQIEQVILNLTRNSIDAMAHGETGPREIVLTAAPAPDDPGFVEVTARDSGPGIAPEIANRLFTPFATTKERGMGLGLAISRSIIEAHGGRIRAIPANGRGTLISFTIPIYTDVA